MREHLVLFSTTFVLTLLAIFILIPVANKIGLVDKPHGRKQHVGSIPLIGGISIFTGVAATLAIFGLPQDSHWYYLLCGGSIVLLGVFDDFLDLSVKLRLIAQVIIALGSLGIHARRLNGDVHFAVFWLGVIKADGARNIVKTAIVRGNIQVFNFEDHIGVNRVNGVLLGSHSGSSQQHQTSHSSTHGRTK